MAAVDYTRVARNWPTPSHRIVFVIVIVIVITFHVMNNPMRSVARATALESTTLFHRLVKYDAPTPQ
jgi:hypothetical protein